MKVDSLDPTTVDFTNPENISGNMLKRLQKKMGELESSNFDRFVMRNIADSDIPTLCRDAKKASITQKNKLLGGFRKKLNNPKGLDASAKERLENNITILLSIPDDLITEMSWKEHVCHCITSLSDGSPLPRHTELVKEIICHESVIKAYQEARAIVKKKRREQEKRELSKKRKTLETKDDASVSSDEPPRAKKSESKATEREIARETAVRSKVLSSLEAGTVLMCVVEGACDYGVFLRTYHMDAKLKCLCHVSRVHREGKMVSGERLPWWYARGDRLTAVVLSVDADKERVSVSFRDADFAAHTKMTHKHLRGDQPAALAAQQDSRSRGPAVTSTRVSLDAPAEGTKRVYEDALVLVRKLNCRSTSSQHRGKRMSKAMRVKLTAEFLALDPQREYNKFVFREKVKQVRKRRVVEKLARARAEAGQGDEEEGSSMSLMEEMASDERDDAPHAEADEEEDDSVLSEDVMSSSDDEAVQHDRKRGRRE